MVRVWGRQPRLAAGGFQGYSLFVRSLRLAVRTSPSHGENRSSILLGSASLFKGLAFQNRLQTGFWEGLGENPWTSTSVHSLKISIHFHLSVKQSLGDLAGLRSPKGSVRTLCGSNANPKCWDSSKHDRFDNFIYEGASIWRIASVTTNLRQAKQPPTTSVNLTRRCGMRHFTIRPIQIRCKTRDFQKRQ
jgi:hypothetical protein